jgi:hypothetical protein
LRWTAILFLVFGAACSKTALPPGVLAQGTVGPVLVSADGSTFIHWSDQLETNVVRDSTGQQIGTLSLHLPSLAPDGAYVAGLELPDTLRILPLRGGAAHEIAGVGPSNFWVWSPASDALAYTRDTPNMPVELLTLGDGNTVTLAANLSSGVGFSPDGRWVVFSSGGSLQLKPVAGGPTSTLGSQGGGAAFSRDGTVVVWSESVAGPAYRLSSMTLAGGAPIPLAEDPAGMGPVRFTNDGRWIVFRSGLNEANLRAVPVAGGQIVDLLPGAAGSTEMAPFGTAGVDVMGFGTGDTSATLRTFATPDATPSVVVSGIQPSGLNGFALDGAHAFANVSVPNAPGTYQLKLVDVATGGTVALGSQAASAVFSPDSSRLAAQVDATFAANQGWPVGTLRVVDMSGADVIPPASAVLRAFWLSGNRLLIETALSGQYQAQLAIVPVPARATLE